MDKYVVIAHCADGDVKITPVGKDYFTSYEEAENTILVHSTEEFKDSGVEFSIVDFSKIENYEEV